MDSHAISYTFCQTPAGILQVGWQKKAVCEAFFIEDQSIKTQKIPQDITNFMMNGTAFQKKVWESTLQIPRGTTVSYQELAEKIGQPKAYRAVATALANNTIAYLIPCHRVLRKNGQLGGYRWGLARKAALLASEKALP